MRQAARRRAEGKLRALWVGSLLVGPLLVVAAPAAHADLTAPDLAESWAVSIPTEAKLAAPVVGDLTGDGVAEIVVAGHDGIVRALRSDGSTLWTAAAQVTPGGPAVAVDASPTIADIDGDGSPEVIVNAQSLSVANQGGGTVAFSATGAIKWRWAGGDDIFNMWNPAWGTRADGYREGALSTPTIGDINGDGTIEVVVGALDNRVHVLNGSNGSEMSGWTSRNSPGYWVDDSIFSSPSVFDGDGDGRDEIYVGVAASPGGPIDHAGGAFMSLGFDGNAPQIEWINYVGEVVNSSPAIGDLDGDGRPEIVVGTGWDYATVNGTSSARSVYAWHTDDGSTVGGWPVVLNGTTYSSPAIGDLDGDGKPEVVIGSWPRPGAGTGDGRVYAIRADGSILWERDPHQFVSQINAWEGGGGIVGSAVIADVNGDGRNDVIVPNPWATFTMNGADGSRLFAPLRKGWTSENAAAVARFGNAGWRIITFGSDGSSSVVASWPISAPGTTPPWAQWRGAANHRGVHESADAQCPTVPAISSNAAATSSATYHPVSPARILDTRTTLGGRPRPLGARCALPLKVTGVGNIPSSGVDAVTMNVTVTQPGSGGFVTVYPCGVETPTASNVNFIPRQNVANLVTVAVGVGGQVCFYSYSRVHVVVDVAGWYGGTTGSRLVPASPNRFVDTRLNSASRAAGKLAGGQFLRVPIAGANALPASGISAVSMNLTAVDADGGGYLTAYPCDVARPETSSVNYGTGQIVANHVVVPVAADGSVCVFAYATSHVLVDVMGYYSSSGGGARYRSLSPVRLVDSRNDASRMGDQSVRRVHVTDANGVPGSGATGVTLNVTAVNPSGDGYFGVFPCGSGVPDISSLNYTTNAIVPNYVTVGIGDGGDVCIFTWRGADVVVDLAGWFG